MKITDTKTIKFHKLREEIEAELNSKGDKGLRMQEVWAIQRVLDRKGIVLVQNEETRSQASFLMRTTVLLYILFTFLLAVTYCPIKWIFTGYYMLDPSSRLYRFINAWEAKLD